MTTVPRRLQAPRASPGHPPVPDRPGAPTWRTAREAWSVLRYGPHRHRITVITAVVGTVLVGINQSTVLASGHIDWLVWIRIALDYLVPACVSSMGVLSGTRREPGQRARG